MPCATQISLITKVRIVEMTAAGKTQLEIATNLGVNQSTISRVIRRWRNDRELEARKRSGCPAKLNNRDHCQLARTAQQNPRASLRELIQIAGLNISEPTARASLH